MERDSEADDEEEQMDIGRYCSIAGVWERSASRSRATRSETVQVRMHDWQQARRPEHLLARCIGHLMERVLRGRPAPMRISVAMQPPGWEGAYHVPLRSPEQNTPAAIADALEALARQYDGLDLFSGEIRFRICAVWPHDARGACADNEAQACGTVRCRSFVPILNGDVDRHCMARAVVIGLADRQHRVAGGVDAFRAFCTAQRGAGGALLARQLLQAAGIPLALPNYGAPEAQCIQRWLDTTLGAGHVRLVLFERESGYRITWKGPRTARFNLCLVVQARHFGYIQRPEQLFKAKRYCMDCEQLVDRRSHPQGCRAVCTMCMRFGWGFPCQPGGADAQQQRCNDCGFVFPNGDCFDAHRRRLEQPPPGWEHDRRYGRRAHRPLCEERRICPRCRRIVWARAGIHMCGGGGGGAPFQQQHGRGRAAPAAVAAIGAAGAAAAVAGVCQRCSGVHDPCWTPCFIQPKQHAVQWPGQQMAAEVEDDDDDGASADNEPTEAAAGMNGRRPRKPLRFVFWDVECEQRRCDEQGAPVLEDAEWHDDDEDWDEDNAAAEDGNGVQGRRHRPLLVCAEVLCERCISDGVQVEREPIRRAVGCRCGVPWRGANRRRWAMRIGEDAFPADADGEDVAGVEEAAAAAAMAAVAPGQMPADGLNPRRLRFLHCAHTGRSPMHQFADFLLNTGPRGVQTLMLAHNGGRYDAHLLLEELQRRGQRPKRFISNGLRVYSLTVSGNHQRELVCKDSLNFFGCALDALPATFGLDVAPKPFFPYRHIRADNMEEVHCGLPPEHAYDPHSMRPARRAAFLQWYGEQQRRWPDRPFHLRRELVRYCANDVRILREASLRFRQIVGELAGGMEPFLAASTIAGLALAIYRQCHLPPNAMVHTPEGGCLRGRRASAASRRFFALLEERRPEWRYRLRTARWSIGEQTVEDDGYRLDAILYRDPPLRPLAIEFNGCYYHGCLSCYPRRQQRLAGGQSAELLYARTQQRAWDLSERHGFEVSTVWECQFQQALRGDADLRRAYGSERVRQQPAPMDLRRDALFGGRVEPFALYYACAEGEEIDDLDIVSLYPFVMKCRDFPIGQPQVLSPDQLFGAGAAGNNGTAPVPAPLPWRRPADNPFKGFIMCRVLPPTPAQLGQRHTLLPYRTPAGRLTFPLCAKCADGQRVWRTRGSRCRHSDVQRSWQHAYTHVELNRALAMGYRVLAVHEVWHYAQWASQEAGNSLFARYVDTLMRIKVEASGWPADCVTPEQRAAYVRDYTEREGIHIDQARVHFNPGLRAVAKALLNSLWGKLAQRAERDEVRYTATAREFHDLLADSALELVDFVHLNEHMDRCTVRQRHPFVRAPATNNLAVACFVTAHARVCLHERLDEVRQAGGRVLYCDTDSILYVKRRDAAPLACEGNALGQMKREWPRRRIVEFCSAGPKNYAFRHLCARSGADEQVERKIRGLELTYTASQLLPFRRMCDMVINFFGRRPNTERQVSVPYRRFVRTKRAHIYTRHGRKLYRPVFTKGLVVAPVGPDATGRAFYTRPFGWWQHANDDDNQ